MIEFRQIVHATLTPRGIAELLDRGAAVILERVAYGGGRTEWYYCRGRAALAIVEGSLRPGSAVSFCFDGRIARSRWTPEIIAIDEEGDAIIGTLSDDGIRIDHPVVVCHEELAELAATTTEVFWGRFPGRDDDGVRAVSVILPDADGVVRPHPH